MERGFVPRRILIIQLRQVGDAIMCTPAIRALRKAFPESRLDFLAEPPAAMAIGRNPDLENVIIIDRGESWGDVLRLISRIRGNRYDLVIDFLANPASAIISKLGGAKFTLSYAGKRRSRLYTHTVAEKGEYSAAHKLSLLQALAVEDGDLRPEFYISDKARKRIDDWLDGQGISKNERFVVIDPTHRRETRRYTRFAEVARLILSQTGIRCVFVWGPGEQEEVRSILKDAGEGHLIAPRTDLDELGAMISRAALLTGNDSAPRHIAAALGTPTVITIGATQAKDWTLPLPIHRTVALDIECRPCDKNKCKFDEVNCMTRLEPEKVFREIRDILS